MDDEGEKPPFFSSWRNAHLMVLGALALHIALLLALSRCGQ
jgi:hypothetical protein